MSGNRYDDALYINAGACNPKGVARALVEAIDQVCRERNATDVRSDPAVQLILHQLCHLAGMICDFDYTGAVRACSIQVAPRTREMLRLVNSE
jgi:hypothetical protein